MNIIVSVLLSTVLIPASGVYNAYVSHNMLKDVPLATSGPHVPIREYAKPIVLKGKGNNGSKAVLMIHGFSGSPADFGNLPKLFQSQGYDVFAPLLPAHGRGARALEHVQANEWLEYVSNQYRELRSTYKELTLIGLSMGASLSVLTAAEHFEDAPDKMILLSPFFRVKQKWYYFLPVETYHEWVSEYVPYFQSLPGQSAVCKESAHAKRFVKRQYVATHATREAFRIAKAAREKIGKWSALQIPILILQSKNDRVTDYKTTRRIVDSLNTSHVRLVSLTRANHVLPRDCEANFIEETIMKF